MDMNQVFPSKYLKASDLQGKQVKVVIDHVDMETLGEDRRPVVYFQNKEKGVVLNKTNTTNIAQTYGWDSDDWSGREVVLYTAWVDFQGKSVEAIRIRPPSATERRQNSPSRPQAPIVEQPRRMEPVTEADLTAMDDEIPF